MKINIYVVEKKSRNSLYEPLIEHFIKSSKAFAKVDIVQVFNKNIAKAKRVEEAQHSYTQALDRFLSRGYSVTLNPSSKEIDSLEFASLLKDKSEISFFIGGAYGFEKKFLLKSNKTISFGKITVSHKLIKVVLMEQIFRGLSIINNHPYHK